MSTITIAAIQGQEGNKPSVVVTTDGNKLKCFPDKIAKWGIEIGASYNVETQEYTNNWGTTHTITSAKRITLGALATNSAPAPTPFVSGLPHPSGPASAPQAAAPFRTPETLFVQGLLEHYIDAGQCPPTELIRYINAIRFAWQRTLGEPGPFVSGGGSVPYNQAAE